MLQQLGSVELLARDFGMIGVIIRLPLQRVQQDKLNVEYVEVGVVTAEAWLKDCPLKGNFPPDNGALLLHRQSGDHLVRLVGRLDHLHPQLPHRLQEDLG